MFKKTYGYLLISILIFTVDRITKVCALQWLTPYSPKLIFPGLNFTLVFNHGAAFSFLSEQSGWQRVVLSVISLVVSVILAYLIHRLKPEQRLQGVALSCVLGGALGNLWGRFLHGFVVDFIDVYVQWSGSQWHWPAFNIADSAICIGVVLLLVDNWRQAKQAKAKLL